jgi:hypothetical protein
MEEISAVFHSSRFSPSFCTEWDGSGRKKPLLACDYFDMIGGVGPAG